MTLEELFKIFMLQNEQLKVLSASMEKKCQISLEFANILREHSRFIRVLKSELDDLKNQIQENK